MRTLQDGYRGITMLVGLAWDRIFFGAAIAAGLLAAAAIAQGLAG